MTTNVSAGQMRLTEQVAEEIRALLARRRMSGRELARRLGASYSWVNFRLTGAQPITLDDLDRIAAVLEVDYRDLMPQREGRVVTHIGATRSQDTVSRVGSLTDLARGRKNSAPANRSSSIQPSDRRVRRMLPAAA